MTSSLPLADQLRHHNSSQYRLRRLPASPSSTAAPLCDQSTAAAFDVIMLLLVLGSMGFLFTPYFKYVCHEFSELLPATFLMIGEVVYQAPVAYAAGALLMFISVIGAWEIYQYKCRKCDNPDCRGLRKAMELDIQLETEQCVKSAPVITDGLSWKGGVDLGHEQKELEAELRRMAPPNGRAILIFRAPCGCPAARFEAWGSKKARRTKK